MGIMGITMTELNVHLGSFRTGPADLSAQSTGSHLSPKAQRPQKNQVVNKGSSFIVCMFVVIMIPKSKEHQTSYLHETSSIRIFGCRKASSDKDISSPEDAKILP